jgi:hypothetical protein
LELLDDTDEELPICSFVCHNDVNVVPDPREFGLDAAASSIFNLFDAFNCAEVNFFPFDSFDPLLDDLEDLEDLEDLFLLLP